MTLILKHSISLLFLNMAPALPNTRSISYFHTLSFSYNITLILLQCRSHSFTMWLLFSHKTLSHFQTMPLSHSYTMLFSRSQRVSLSLSHEDTLSFSNNMTLILIQGHSRSHTRHSLILHWQHQFGASRAKRVPTATTPGVWLSGSTSSFD